MTTPSELRAGVAEVNITPPMGVEMCGYGPYEKRLCTEVLDPLLARALWLETPKNRMAIITLDLCTIDLALRNQVTGELKRACGMDESCVLLAASHTHSGPPAQLMIGWGQRDPQYLSALPGLIVRAVTAARDAAAPARVGSARRRIRDVGVNREQTSLGPTDTAAQLMRIDRADGTPMAAVFNFGAHAVGRYPYTARISADWPGMVAASVRTAMRGAVALFLQGPCGDVNAHEMGLGRGDVGAKQQVCDMRVGAMAKRLCDQVLPALEDIRTSPSAELRAAWRTVALPCAAPDGKALRENIDRHRPSAEGMTLADLRPLHERIADETDAEKAWRQARFEVDASARQLELLDSPPYEVEAPIHLLVVGEAAIVGWPGEIFLELGLELRRRSPRPLTFVASFANHTVGYIPTAAAYESQGRPHAFGHYPTAKTPLIYGQLPFRKDVGRILIDQTLDLLEST